MQLVLLYSLLTTISAIALPGGVVSAILEDIEHGHEALLQDRFYTPQVLNRLHQESASSQQALINSHKPHLPPQPVKVSDEEAWELIKNAVWEDDMVKVENTQKTKRIGN
jgi:hypothetical protein